MLLIFYYFSNPGGRGQLASMKARSFAMASNRSFSAFLILSNSAFSLANYALYSASSLAFSFSFRCYSSIF